jgi:hypothetical protein
MSDRMPLQAFRDPETELAQVNDVAVEKDGNAEPFEDGGGLGRREALQGKGDGVEERGGQGNHKEQKTEGKSYCSEHLATEME